MNIYSDTFHSTLKYLKDTEVNIDKFNYYNRQFQH